MTDKMLSFRTRCRYFWQWFTVNEEKIADRCRNPQQYDKDELMAFMNEGMDLLGPAYFNMGGEYEFTFTVSGERYRFYLLPYLVACAPAELKQKWKFFSYMQPAHVSAFDIEMHGQRLNMGDIQVLCRYDQDREKFALEFYHDALCQLEDEEAYNLFFTAMDLTLGEGLSMTYVQEVNRVTQAAKEMLSLQQLRAHMVKVLQETGKKVLEHPAEQYTVYRLEPQENQELRYDVMVGGTAYTELVADYYNKEYGNVDCLEQWGAKAGFLAFSFQNEDRSNILEIRHAMEESLAQEVFHGVSPAESGELFQGGETGRVLGGAMGTGCAYIDLLIFDEEDFLDKVRDWAQKYPYVIYYSEFRQEVELVELGPKSYGHLWVGEFPNETAFRLYVKEHFWEEIHCKSLAEVDHYYYNDLDLPYFLQQIPTRPKELVQVCKTKGIRSINSFLFAQAEGIGAAAEQSGVQPVQARQMTYLGVFETDRRQYSVFDYLEDSKQDSYEKLLERAGAYMQEFNYTQAETLLRQIETEGVSRGKWNYRLSVCLLFQNRFQEALIYARQGVKVEPEYPWTYLQTCKLAYWAGDNNQALAEADKGLALVPGDREFTELIRGIKDGDPFATEDYDSVVGFPFADYDAQADRTCN